MNDAVAAHLRKAEQELRAARLLLDGGEADVSIGRSYYAMFHGAKAALELIEEHPKTHRGTYDRFWIRFVEEGLFPRPLAELLLRGRTMREGADYDAFTRFDAAAAANLLDDAKAFVAEINKLIERLQEDRS